MVYFFIIGGDLLLWNNIIWIFLGGLGLFKELRNFKVDVLLGSNSFMLYK